MQYRINPRNGDRLSVLGFGAMRMNGLSEREREKIIVRAVEGGINYFDTAYIYPGSEAALGRVLAKGYRSRVKLATKLPHYLVRKHEDLDKIFAAQLQRLQTDYVDYYLIHTLNDTAIWRRLLDLGILEWAAKKKNNGHLINLGFSYHGGQAEFCRVLDAQDWDFCLIQYNYLDEYKQAGRAGLEYAAHKGLPVMVMEPLRGGRLVDGLPKQALSVWQNSPQKRSTAEWGLRFVWNHPGVTLALSGMNSLEMLEENLRLAENAEANALSPEELALYEEVRQLINSGDFIPCTGCNYCLPCPSGVDIPTCFACFNDCEVEGKLGARRKYLMQTAMNSLCGQASQCSGCGSCEKRCPQNIAIREELKRVAKTMEGLSYKPLSFVLKKFMKL